MWFLLVTSLKTPHMSHFGTRFQSSHPRQVLCGLSSSFCQKDPQNEVVSKRPVPYGRRPADANDDEAGVSGWILRIADNAGMSA